MAFLFAASALDSTNFVCDIGPSDASTRSTTPSTILIIRSTSPEKSACPGKSFDRAVTIRKETKGVDIGYTWGIDNVQDVVTVMQTSIFRHNCNAPFLFVVIGIHCTIPTEGSPAMLEQFVHESGLQCHDTIQTNCPDSINGVIYLAMINMCNDCTISNLTHVIR